MIFYLYHEINYGGNVLERGASAFELFRSIRFNPFPNNKFYSCKLKEFADDNFKFDENKRNLSKLVENTVGEGEIARYEQFLILPQCFQKTCTADTQKPGLFGKGLTHSHTITPFDAPGKQAF